MSISIGLLLPRSAIYPTINFDLMAGLRNGLEAMGIKDAAIRTDSIGTGTDDKLIYAQCERMLFEGARIVAGYINPRTAEILQPLFAGANAIFIALDAGYQYFSPDRLGNVFSISLQGTLCCRILSHIASLEGKKKLAFVSSFYDAGYRAAYAFSRSLEEEKGQITYNHITKLKRADFSLDDLQTHLQDSVTEGILASFCGDMMFDFCSEASRTNLFENLPVYASPFMAEEYWLGKTPYPGVNFRTCVPWASGLEHEANKQIKQVFEERKQKVNVFSVLGWEAALLIAAFAAGEDTEAGITILEGREFDSPRGKIVVNAASHQVEAPVYEAVIAKDETTGNCLLAVGDAVSFVDDQRERTEEDVRSFAGHSTSWLNTYPCLDS